MAKRKAIKGSGRGSESGDDQNARAPQLALGQRLFSSGGLLGVAAAMLAAAQVYAGYWPHDSIAVQGGEARYLIGLLLAAAGLALVVRGAVSTKDWLIDALAWGLAFWMVVATWANADGSNLRLAVNELWWWIAAAALLSSTRRCITSAGAALAMLLIICGVSLGVSVFGWHQLLIAFPEMTAQYEANPERALQEAGIIAEEGSAQRIMFENRLRDGGPTGTFALANSMAALLVGGSVVMVALAGGQWRRMRLLQRIAWGAALPVTLGMLLASRSRSAVAAIALVALLYLVLRLLAAGLRPDSTALRWSRRGVQIALVAALVSITALGLAAAQGGDAWRQSEWVSQAPASLAIRIDYWRACAGMLAHWPLFGVGPGQFKARYEGFRAPELTEQIADPHNWLWQAATTGGIPAGLLLLGLAVAVLWRFSALSAAPNAQRATVPPPAVSSADRGRFSSRWVYAGALAAAMAIWIAGAMIGYLPMFDAALAGTLAGVALIYVAVQPLRATHDPRAAEVAAPDETIAESGARRGLPGDSVDWAAIRSIARWAAAAMAVHLLTSGGLTVPGVAVTLWVLAGIATPCVGGEPAAAQRPLLERGRTSATRWVLGGVAAVLLLSWYTTAVLPVEQAAGATERFHRMWTQRRHAEAETALRQAMDADRWNPDPPLHLAQVLMQQALYDPRQRQHWETRWHEAEAVALRRAGQDAAIIRVLADARLWHYQRYGDQAVLQRAADLYRHAVELSPSHQTYAAQLAEIYRELGDDRAAPLAESAKMLSQQGGYFERSLPFIILYPAEHGGDVVLAKPLRRPASEVLAPLLQPPN